jgi:predicted RNase H-like HicB family nuclease
MKYLVVIERANGNYSAYLPDLPGCVAAGDTVEEVLQLIRRAVDMHLRGMEEDGLTIPEPSARADYVSLEKAS